MPTISLPDLPADLHRLIHMEPTFQHLDDFIGGGPSAWPGHGTYTSTFSVSNVFSSPLTAPWGQRRFDLWPKQLADALDWDLLVGDIPDTHSVEEVIAQVGYGQDLAGNHGHE